MLLDSEGGILKPTLEFVDWLVAAKEQRQLKLSAKIYEASSAAAMIALVADSRRISENGAFGLHIESLRIEASDISKNGMVAERHRTLVSRSRDVLYSLLAKDAHLPNRKLCTLDAKGTLILTPTECLEFGICSDIFSGDLRQSFCHNEPQHENHQA